VYHLLAHHLFGIRALLVNQMAGLHKPDVEILVCNSSNRIKHLEGSLCRTEGIHRLQFNNRLDLCRTVVAWLHQQWKTELPQDL